MSALLSVRGLGVRYRGDGGTVEALSGVDLDIGSGERLAVIGESGSGKSTLALALAGLLPPTAEVAGRIDWPGLSHTPRKGREIGFVFQDPAASLDPVMTIGDQVAEVVKAHHRVTRRQASTEAVDLLARVELPEPAALARSYPHALSGGQRQRVAIAAALAGRPALLIADEATSALDTIVQARIVALLLRLVAEDGMALLFISHDIALASGLADRIAVFLRGRLVEVGRTADIVADPRDRYTQALIDAQRAVALHP